MITLAFALVLFPSPDFSFVLSVPVLATQIPVSTFPFIRLPLTVVPTVPNLSAFQSPVSMLPSGFGTGHAASSFHRPDFRHTAANISALPFLSGGKFPIAFALGSGYLAGQCTLKTEH